MTKGKRNLLITVAVIAVILLMFYSGIKGCLQQFCKRLTKV